MTEEESAHGASPGPDPRHGAAKWLCRSHLFLQQAWEQPGGFQAGQLRLCAGFSAVVACGTRIDEYSSASGYQARRESLQDVHGGERVDGRVNRPIGHLVTVWGTFRLQRSLNA